MKIFYGVAKLPVNDCIEGNPQGYVAKVVPEAFIIMLGSTGSNEDINNIRSDNNPIKRHYMAYAIAKAIFYHFGVKWKPKPGFEKHFEFQQFEPEPEKITAPVKKVEPKVELPPPPEVYSQKKCLESKERAYAYNNWLKTDIDNWKKYMFFEGLMDGYWRRAFYYGSTFESLISIFEQLLLLKKGGERK